MKAVLKLLFDHAQEYLNSKVLLGFASICIALVALNYTFDYEDQYIDTIDHGWLRFSSMFLFQALPYLAICFLVYRFGDARAWLRSPSFWMLFFIGFGLLALDRTWSLWPWVEGRWPESEIHYIYRIIIKSKGVLTIIIPLFLLSFWFEDQSNRTFFGLSFKGFHAKPYFVLLAVGLVFIVIGGLFSDIQTYYPKYGRAYGDVYAEARQIPEWIAVLVFESAYGFSFISTEFFFRGFLIVGMGRVLGPHAVLPMVMAYCVLHFGKPMTEAISSVFGGYILGVIALHHKSIWGGVIIHVGIAWGMELVGYLAKN